MMAGNRRQFMVGCAASTWGLLSTRGYWRISKSLEQIRLGVIGFGGRGKDLIGAVRAQPNARLVALCDADSDILGKFEPENRELFRTQDFRALLDRKDVDAIVSATPNHWHTLITMLACQAGKDVYIEKPISHNLEESRQVVRASRHYKRIVQCGFQNRSDSALRPFFERLQAGEFGRVQHVQGTCHRPRDPIGRLEKRLVVPPTIDYDKWLGPAADEPLFRPRLHYDWHWDFNTGNGDVGNQGPHEWDLMNWALGDPENLPTEMQAAGNRFGWNDAGNTPNVMACRGVTNGIPFCFEVVNLKNSVSAPQGIGVGVIITTDQGVFAGGRGGGKFTRSDGKVIEFKPEPKPEGGDGTTAHMANFLRAVESRDRSGQHSECAVAARSAAMAHMANLSYQLAEVAELDRVQEALGVEQTSQKMSRRLGMAPELFALNNPGATVTETWKLGPRLVFDNRQQLFTGESAERANERISRNYRKNYELPVIP